MSKTFQPDSLHPYIMDARLKKATGSGGITEIPIASADTVGGIMIGGSANPITITGSGNASVRKATSELLGVVKAGDGISVDADGAISGVPYSTTEHKIGRKWTDGKDIYEKTLTFETAVSISTSSIGSIGVSNSGISTIIKGYATNADGACTPLTLSPNYAGEVTIFARALGYGGTFSAKTITFEFTKTN